MPDIARTLHGFSQLEELARQDTAMHRVHPLAVFLSTIFFIAAVVSFDRYAVAQLFPFFLYPALVFSIGQIPVSVILKRALVAAPFILGVGLACVLSDRNPVPIAGQPVSGGWVNAASLIVKCVLTVTAALLLIATTGIQKLSCAMRMLRIPRIFILQLTLTYRYLSVLAEEVMHTTRAYAMRAPREKGIRPGVWGPLAGHILLRTFERAQYVYRAMNLRGFTGEYHPGGALRFALKDAAYVLAWALFFAAARIFDIPSVLGSVF